MTGPVLAAGAKEAASATRSMGVEVTAAAAAGAAAVVRTTEVAEATTMAEMTGPVMTAEPAAAMMNVYETAGTATTETRLLLGFHQDASVSSYHSSLSYSR